MTSRRTAAAAALLALGLAGCSVSTNPDEAGLEYDAGPFSSTEFSNCIKPGTRDYHGPGDKGYVYPAGQRTFAFGGEEAQMPAATVVSNDDLELKVKGLVTFALNTDCETLRQFHERLGRKYNADTAEGWTAALTDYVGKPLERALDDATKGYAWRDLYTSGDTKAEWEQKVGELTGEYIAEQGGGDFFCKPTYAGGEKEKCGTPQLTIQQPTPPKDVVAALTQAQEAVELTRAQEEENKRVQTELEAIEDLVDVLGPEGYVLYEAMRRGEIDLMPVPEGGNLNVTPNGGN